MLSEDVKMLVPQRLRFSLNPQDLLFAAVGPGLLVAADDTAQNFESLKVRPCGCAFVF